MQTEKPKFNIGDTVFFIHESGIVERLILGIFTIFNKNLYEGESIKDAKVLRFEYYTQVQKDVDKYGWKNESKLFSSKEDLIASL